MEREREREFFWILLDLLWVPSVESTASIKASGLLRKKERKGKDVKTWA